MTTVEQLCNLIDKWKVNKAFLASKMNMPKGSFHNKLTPNHETTFTDKEVNQLCTILKEMGDELSAIESADFNDALKIISQNQP